MYSDLQNTEWLWLSQNLSPDRTTVELSETVYLHINGKNNWNNTAKYEMQSKITTYIL